MTLALPVTNPKFTAEESAQLEAMRAELAKLKAENETLKAGTRKGLSMKITEKGGLSVYGLGRFPVTLYKDQWITLLNAVDEIKLFITANLDKLTSKPAGFVSKVPTVTEVKPVK